MNIFNILFVFVKKILQNFCIFYDIINTEILFLINSFLNILYVISRVKREMGVMYFFSIV